MLNQNFQYISAGLFTCYRHRIKNLYVNRPVLSKLSPISKEGWPQNKWTRDEISIEVGCLFLGIRAIIPEECQSKLLQELHNGHPAMSRMKSIARSYM